MDFRNRRADLSLLLAVLLLVAALVVSAMSARETVMKKGEDAAAAQDTTRIESRLSQLEQRLYGIEVSIRGLEQQSRISGVNSGRSDPEVTLLRTEVETLRRRVAEVECGLARVDERTLSAATREARRRAGTASGDPCRLNTDAPLQLPTRP
jgi:uncharacterized protein YlxW (UPF0749 family)